MKLVVVSHVAHYRHAGRLYAYGPYAREIDLWAEMFSHVFIASPLREEEPPGDCVPFAHDNISMKPQVESGGDSLSAKVAQLLMLPLHLWNLSRAMAGADAIHVRCPGNLGLLGALLAPLFSRRIVAKYAGQWQGGDCIPFTFRLQRRILASRWWRRGIVTVYGRWDRQPDHVVPFFTSMMTARQVSNAMFVAARKAIGQPLQLLYSGRLAPLKGVDLLLRALYSVAASGIGFHLTILGDGPQRLFLERLTAELGLQDRVTFHGAVCYDDVMSWYERAHILVLVSNTEGWPKAISEAMCHGVVCIGSSQGLLPWMLEDRGITVPLGDPNPLAAAIVSLVRQPERYARLSGNAARWARRYSLESLRDELRTVLCRRWNVPLREEPSVASPAMTEAGH